MNATNFTKRLDDIDILKGWAILLVVMGHSVPGDMISNMPSVLAWAYKWIYSFHMPLFMMASGFLFAYKGAKNTYGKFVSNKFKRLLLPYFIITLLVFIPKVILSHYALRPLQFSLSSLIESILYPRDNPILFFWFLPTLFIIFLAGPLWKRLGQLSFWTQAAFTFLLAVCYISQPFLNVRFLNLCGVIHYLIFFWIGCLLANNYQKLTDWLEKKTSFFILLALTVALNFIPGSDFTIRFIAAVIGILMSVSLAKQALKFNQQWLSFFGRYSYQIYLLSWFPQSLSVLLLYRILHWPFFIASLAMLISGIFIPILCAIGTNRYFSRFNIVIGQ